MRLTKIELKERAWYRILQVIFGLLGIASVVVLMIILWQNKPTKISDPIKSTFTCISKTDSNFGQTYNLGGGGANVDSDGALSSWDIQKITDWCNNNNYRFNSSGSEINYRTNIVFKIEPSWIRFISYNLVGLVVIGILFSILRGLFLYIATGKFR